MGFAKSRQIYEALPLAVKRVVCLAPFGCIAGRAYRKTLARDWRIERMDCSEIEAYQNQALRETLQFATDQIPAYRDFRSAVERFSPFDTLKEFPLIDKDVLQENLHEYLPRDFDRIPHYECSTGGTSGNQLTLFLDDNSQSVETAFMHRQWRRVGYTTRIRKATFRGVSFPDLKPDVYWQHNPIYNELQFSPFHMNQDTMHLYFEELLRYRPAYLHGYPSAIGIFADFILRNQLNNQLPPIRAALLGSEGCLPGQREQIEEAFQTRVFTWYGHSERLILAGECEHTSVYHHFPDYGILEIIDDDGTPCVNEGEKGELVGTGLLNRSLPLIRYRTGDYAVRRESKCQCGRNWDRFSDVEGHRSQDMVVGKNGTKMSLAALNMHGPVFDKIARYQYHQNQPGVCEIRVMTAPDFNEVDAAALEKAYRYKVGDEVVFKVKHVKDIPLTARGKLKLLDSTL